MTENQAADERWQVSALSQKVCVWTGFALIVLFLGGFITAGFLVPPSPMAAAEVIAEKFARDSTQIRVGMLVTMFAAALLVPWSTGMFMQLRRCAGRWSPMPYVQVLCGAVFSMEFIYLVMFWQVAAFRPDAPPDIVRLLNDMAWIPFVGLVSTAVFQTFSLGWSMLEDRRPDPVFPRWLGYFNIWTSLLFMPGSLDVFFKTGPFAYNGFLAWYMPLGVFAVWMPLNTVLCLKAINRQALEPKPAVPALAA